MSKAPRKPDAAAKDLKKTPRKKTGGRAKGADQSPEAKTERYVRGTAVGEHSHNALTSAGKQRANRLRELIEPETEAMVRVMIDIAKNVDHLRDPEKYPSIHASIRMEAADRVLSRAYGKPKEHVEVSDATDGVSANDEVMTLLGNIFEAVGLPPLLEDKGSLASGSAEGSPTS